MSRVLWKVSETSPSRQLVVKSFLVEHVFAESWSSSLQGGHVGRNLLDGLHLLLKVIPLQEISHLWIFVGSCNLMQIEKCLVNVLLQFQSSLHCLQSSSPGVTNWLRNVLQHNSATTFVLIFHHLLSMFSLLVRRLLEELGESGKSDIITLKVKCHGLVGVAGVQLQIDLLVQTSLTLDMVILTDLRLGHLFCRFCI